MSGIVKVWMLLVCRHSSSTCDGHNTGANLRNTHKNNCTTDTLAGRMRNFTGWSVCLCPCVSTILCIVRMCGCLFLFWWTILTRTQTWEACVLSPFPAGLLLFICGYLDTDQQEPVTHTQSHTQNTYTTSFCLQRSPSKDFLMNPIYFIGLFKII